MLSGSALGVRAWGFDFCCDFSTFRVFLVRFDFSVFLFLFGIFQYFFGYILNFQAFRHFSGLFGFFGFSTFSEKMAFQSCSAFRLFVRFCISPPKSVHSPSQSQKKCTSMYFGTHVVLRGKGDGKMQRSGRRTGVAGQSFDITSAQDGPATTDTTRGTKGPWLETTSKPALLPTGC